MLALFLIFCAPVLADSLSLSLPRAGSEAPAPAAAAAADWLEAVAEDVSAGLLDHADVTSGSSQTGRLLFSKSSPGRGAGAGAAAAAGPRDIEVEVPDPTGRDGFQRAKLFNGCKMAYHAPGWQSLHKPLPVVSPGMHATYMLQGKSASSTIRSGLKKGGEFYADEKKAPPPSWNSTLFTVVRDPLQRAVSMYFEAGFLCTSSNPSKFDAVGPEAQGRYLIGIEEMIANLENGSCDNPHTHGQRARLLDPAQYPLEFVGTVATLKKDWQDLSAFQTTKFGITWPDLPTPWRVRDKGMSQNLNATLLPVSLAQRVCDLYRDDYCCFGLPIPSVCSLDCS